MTVRALIAFLVVLAVGVLVGSAVVQWDPVDSPADTTAVPRQIGERIRVEVLNAGGRNGMARRATDLLRRRGFDVVYFGNAESFGQERSRVLDRIGRLDAARRVSDALGIADVERRLDRNLYLDVTVRLGSDWEPADASSPEPTPDSTEWWRPQELIRELRRR